MAIDGLSISAMSAEVERVFFLYKAPAGTTATTTTDRYNRRAGTATELASERAFTVATASDGDRVMLRRRSGMNRPGQLMYYRRLLPPPIPFRN